MSAVSRPQSFGMAQVILFLAIAILVIVVAFPVLLILFNAFWVDGSFNFSSALDILKEPETYQALLNSLIIASCTTVGSTIVGTFFAWLVTRTDLPHKTFMKGMFLVPFMLPSFIGALAWKMLLSPNAGFINQFFIDHFGFSGPIFNIYTYYGIRRSRSLHASLARGSLRSRERSRSRLSCRVFSRGHFSSCSIRWRISAR